MGKDNIKALKKMATLPTFEEKMHLKIKTRILTAQENSSIGEGGIDM
jgi:hypothetical protein